MLQLGLTHFHFRVLVQLSQIILHVKLLSESIESITQAQFKIRTASPSQRLRRRLLLQGKLLKIMRWVSCGKISRDHQGALGTLSQITPGAIHWSAVLMASTTISLHQIVSTRCQDKLKMIINGITQALKLLLIDRDLMFYS